jgi:hypothetical protein
MYQHMFNKVKKKPMPYLYIMHGIAQWLKVGFDGLEFPCSVRLPPKKCSNHEP